MKNLLPAAIIPFDGYARPVLFGDGAKISRRGSPTNAVAYFKKSGLVTGHLVGRPKTPRREFDLSVR
jgi:hypothetical protein